MIAKEGFPFIIGALVAFFVLWLIPKGLLMAVAFFLFAMFLWFFRDPERDIPPYDDIAVSGADGKVIDIEETEVDGIAYRKVSVFMNLFNVHVNRMPIAGDITKIVHKPGEYVPADRPDAPLRNEQNIIHVDTKYGKMIVKQIAGLVARRTVCYWNVGDHVHYGDRLGIIKFSSRVDHFLPVSFDILVKKGDTVKAGESVLAKYTGTGGE
ncbi:phosphatidylserine decarboxylase [Limisalsivibrio acetivorans]|uniref:phosphatidylserine decarboxylase n=1 Tax=Limisalsivibrio acetivorans TaxID=1304888 RepID=UPI0003B5B4BB|nr:phosphatidylserine decarboxylase [Limisalsivibrio acetivorans]